MELFREAEGRRNLLRTSISSDTKGPTLGLAMQRSNSSNCARGLSRSFPGHMTVIRFVVTHFNSHRATIHPDYIVAGSDELTPYFRADCSTLRYPIKEWLSRHNHNLIDAIVEKGTRVAPNQRGYPSDRWIYTRFEPEKTVEI